MSQAQKKVSLSQGCGKGCNHVDGCPHGKTMGRALPGHCLKEAKSLKHTARDKQKKRQPMEGCLHDGGKTEAKLKKSRTLKVVDKKVKAKVSKKLREERNRKLYPLRRRSNQSKDEALSCQVLLTRLEQNAFEQDSELKEEKSNAISKRGQQKRRRKNNPNAIKTLCTQSKTKNEASTNTILAQEPRKRRLAALNAEAVNSLLLEKTDVPLSKLPKKQHHETALVFNETDDANICSLSKTAAQALKTETCQTRKKAKKRKSEKKDIIDLNLDLYTPTPRRLAGLNAAALLKLTSSTTGSKQRVKMDSKGVCATGKQTTCCTSRVPQPKKQGLKQALPQGGGAACKTKGSESKVKWDGPSDCHCLAKSGYYSHGMMGYPINVVKEEQVETELGSCYCCSGEGSVEYCHRLALYLSQKACSETDEHPVASVKHKCLVAPSSLTHPALTLSAHPCLCADPCYSSYYVHFANHGPRSVCLSTQPLPCAHSSMCPSRVSASKLLSSSVSHASGISHPAFCSPVRSPCCSEGCRVGSYTFSAMQPVTSRACSYATGCSNCSHQIKTEGCSSTQGEQGSSLLVPPALPLSGCPLPRLSPSTTVLPHLLSTLADNRQTEVRGPRECPQSTKPPNGSIGARPTKLSQRQPVPCPASAKQQKKVQRHRTTNGWRPFGEPTEKEVFIAGDDMTVLRQCYEGVQRDGEVIRVRDTVLLRSGPRKKSLPYVAKISALWDDPKTGELMMSLFWYYRPEHTQGGRDPSMHCENEIFASRHQDENSVACIEDRCYVLPLAQYCRFCALVKRRSEGVSHSVPMVPQPSDSAVPTHRLVPDDVDPELVYLCRHVYDFRYGRILKNLQ
ncbi:bromo adjacent homology domain-containing 1 protein isoform X1 [Tachysurus fulvidraco]|uniref:bromo adjacent homology domain-containing 1 protein isoform X1 n=1 Tax=Tachysurus fulvidraco TaxID=1234273 RepID=UPI001FEFDF5F|nr:bromo adjacent homology domain-containing 1 protein isoform X1 [Tachysurus fulvidraco]XP_047657645.1 bromo adjacent homology domain-containing 1 protein isoform X1 [Tachysurus fulvidraco]XP_047657646.1 bromo adjacent homology domain-containing 1 protein isoform X1 [Tachysurus fulvidraco]